MEATPEHRVSATFVNPDRPVYHYTPPSGWMNDPNGLCFFDGEYHLFYQHLMPSHWGHAVSTDFLHWTDLPIALAPDERGFIASGSAVVDWDDTSGFFDGKPGMVAFFTHWRDEAQEQSIAYTHDKGRNWTKYADNPVVPNPGIRDFRDPKVNWHAATQRWVMVVAVADRVHFYVSPNLRDWTFASEFGATYGAHTGVWECPDLIELPVENEQGLRKWTLHISVGAKQGRVMQYFVGTFDGAHFLNENEPQTTLWTDEGADFYAGVAWANLGPDDDRRVWIGWLNNWVYARKLPTEPWQGMMSVPRSLALRHTSEGYRLVQRPVAELMRLRGKEFSWTDHPLAPGENLLEGISGRQFEIVAELEPETATSVGIRIGNQGAESASVSFDPATRTVSVRRSDGGLREIAPSFAASHTAQVADSGSTRIKFHLFLDTCSIELFLNDGETVMSDLFFPGPGTDGIGIFAEGGEARVKALTVYRIEGN